LKFEVIEEDNIDDESNIEQAVNVREILEAKAQELGISYRSNIGNEKLLEKINEVEPNFKA